MSLAAKLPYNHRYAGGFPGLGAQALPQDADCLDYLGRMAVADGAGVEVSVANAVDAFISGAKDAGVWDSIRASCVLAGARTLAGALVPLRDYGPELWAEQTPVINDAEGSAGEWDAATLTMSNTSPTTSIIRPRFDFHVGLEDGKQYRVSGRLSGDLSSIHNSGFQMGNTGSTVVVDPSSGLFDSTGTASGAVLPLLITFDGSLGPFAVTIESLSVREVIAAPTNVANGFVEGDYDRQNGLTGDGATTYLDSGRANNADPRDDCHLSVYATSPASQEGTSKALIGTGQSAPAASHVIGVNSADATFFRSNTAATLESPGTGRSTGLYGVTRSTSSSFAARVGGSNSSLAEASGVPATYNSLVFARLNLGVPSSFSDATISFYSIGTSLSLEDLEDLDTSVTDLMNRIRFALVTGENPAGLDSATIDYVLRGYNAGGTLA